MARFIKSRGSAQIYLLQSFEIDAEILNLRTSLKIRLVVYNSRFWAEQNNQSGVTNYPPPPQALGARASANEVISVRPNKGTAEQRDGRTKGRPNKGTAEQRDGRQGQVLITPPRTWVIMDGSRSLRARSRSLSALSGSLRAGSMRSLR